MNNKKLIIQIIKNTGLSRKEIRDMVDRKIKSPKGELSEVQALLVLAKELAVNMDRLKNKCLYDWIYIRVKKLKPF